MLVGQVKPDGRALDIMVIGLGQAGGNLAAEFFRRGYRALALNTAETDLSALDDGGIYPMLPPERRLHIGLDGYDGAGADPTYARQCIRDHADRIRTAVVNQAGDADAVLLTAGLGGGTGSAVGELVQVLEPDELPVLALMTLPSGTESALVKVNTVRSINEVLDAGLLGWIFVDNGRIATLNPGVSLVDYYPHINGEIVAPLDSLNRLNSRENVTPIRSFDGEDFRKLLLSGGVLNYTSQQIPRVTSEEVVGAFVDACEVSDLMPAGFDVARISYVGLVIEAPESALADVPIAAFERIADALKTETEGAAVYFGIYKTDRDIPVTVRAIASTQSLPSAVRELLGDAKREGRILSEKVQADLQALELGEIESVELFRTGSRRGERGRRPRPASEAVTEKDPASTAPVDDLAMEDGGSRRRGSSTNSTSKDSVSNSLPRFRSRPNRRGRPTGGGRGAPARDSTEPPTTATRSKPSEESKPPPPAPPAPPRDRASPPSPDSRSSEPLFYLYEKTPAPNAPSPNASGRTASPKNAPPRNAPPKADQNLPDARTYDRLVAAYRQAKSDPARKRIAERLKEDGTSKNTAVRYYAVQAMVKLGRKSFSNALLQATEDEDETIRKLAVSALKG